MSENTNEGTGRRVAAGRAAVRLMLAERLILSAQTNWGDEPPIIDTADAFGWKNTLGHALSRVRGALAGLSPKAREDASLALHAMGLGDSAFVPSHTFDNWAEGALRSALGAIGTPAPNPP